MHTGSDHRSIQHSILSLSVTEWMLRGRVFKQGIARISLACGDKRPCKPSCGIAAGNCCSFGLWKGCVEAEVQKEWAAMSGQMGEKVPRSHQRIEETKRFGLPPELLLLYGAWHNTERRHCSQSICDSRHILVSRERNPRTKHIVVCVCSTT